MSLGRCNGVVPVVVITIQHNYIERIILCYFYREMWMSEEGFLCVIVSD